MTKRGISNEAKSSDSEADEECKPCQVAVFGGTLLYICKNEVGDKTFCNDLHKKFNEGQMSINDIYGELRPKVNPGIQEQLDNIMKEGKKLGLKYDLKLPQES